MSLPAKLLIAAPMSLLALSLATPADAFFSKSGHKHRAHVLPDNFTLRKKNATLTLHGKAKTEYADSHYPVFLNKNYPDEYNYFKTTLDLSSNFAWGRKKFGYNAVDASLVLRHKSYWGEAGRTNITDENQTKVCDSLMKAHSHESSKPVVWIKEAWLSTTLNAWGDLRTKNKQTIKAGFFPFKIGRGISLGDSYGTAYKFLAIYSKNNDFSPAGILFSGTILKDRLDYDFYYGLLENKSTTVEQTFNHKKANHIGRNDPWSGSGRDNEVFAGQLHYKHDLGKRGNVVANPYIMYNRALDQKIEFDADSKSELGTMGVGFEYSRNRLEVGGEIAHNFGQELLYKIDRNIVQLESKDGIVKEVYSHLLDSNSATAVRTDSLIASVAATEATAATVGGYTATNRVRPGHQNKYRGMMFVLDGTYKFEKRNVAASVCCGYASGDANPRLSETDKDYHGFVGLNEFYTGKRVPSVIILDARTLNRPLTFSGAAGTVLSQKPGMNDNSFTDIIFFGKGSVWYPKFWSDKQLCIASNSLTFWKDHKAPKVIVATDGTVSTSTTEEASRFMGYEMNAAVSLVPLDNMKVTLLAACFIPGGYYEDIKGALLWNDAYASLDKADQLKLTTANYGMGDDVSCLFGAKFEYEF